MQYKYIGEVMKARKIFLLTVFWGLQGFGFGGALADQVIASVTPVQKFNGENVLVLGNLGIQQHFSMTLWVKPTPSNSDWAAIIDYRHSGTKSFAFHQKGGEQNYFSFGVHSKNGVHGVYAKLSPSEWHHLALIKSQNFMAIFLDGRKVGETALDKKFAIDYLGDEVLTIGGWGYGERRWLGSVSCLYVYDYPITNDEVALRKKQAGCSRG